MFYHDRKPQYTVKVDKPNPLSARDTMHQQQWLAVIEELGGLATCLPIPNSFPQGQEAGRFSYAFLGTSADGTPPPPGRWATGVSLDGKGEFTAEIARP